MTCNRLVLEIVHSVWANLDTLPLEDVQHRRASDPNLLGNRSTRHSVLVEPYYVLS